MGNATNGVSTSPSTAERLARIDVAWGDLALPQPRLPRPGDLVSWFQGQAPVSGVLMGHTATSQPVVTDQGGYTWSPPSFDSIRLADPDVSVGPCWTGLPGSARIVRPHQTEREALKYLLDQRTPPGPKYIELISEIWMRGHEVFVVGGTVRDVIVGHPTKDVDLVTTMPLFRLHPIVLDMYRRPEKLERQALENGHLRLGGKLQSTDPFIDVSVFKDRYVGSPNAMFSSSFVYDVANRDFACNAVYFDPINDVLIDPTGQGIRDAELKRLRPVCEQGRRMPWQLGQIAIRYIKFRHRGYTAVDGCAERIPAEFIPMLATMDEVGRLRYIKRQLFAGRDGRSPTEVVQAVEAEFTSLGATQSYATLIEPFLEELLK